MVFSQTAFSSQKCGWAYVGNTHDGAIKAYIDYCKIGYVGRYRFAYFMTDYKTPVKNVRGDYYKSEIRKRLFDCQSKQKVDTQFYHYYLNQATGPLVWSGTVSERQWKFGASPPGSISEFVLDTICSQP
jgi:hypothetical protein